LPEYNAKISKRRRTDAMFRAYELWNGARDRARRRDIEFTVPRAFVERALVIGRCQVTNLQFDLALKSKRCGALSPSLDRIDQQKGYTEDNTQVVCWIYNRAKGDGTHEDVMMLMEALDAVKISGPARFHGSGET